MARYYLICKKIPVITLHCIVLFILLRISPLYAEGIGNQLRIIRGKVISTRSIPIAKVLIKEGEDVLICSGALISPRVVMTASHCVRRSMNLSVCIYGSCRSVYKTRVHPGAFESVENGPINNDVGLLFLRRPVTYKYFSILASKELEPGADFSIFGFGLDEHGDIGSLKKGVMKIDSISKYFIFASYDGSKSNTCSGDSGGPAIMSYTDSIGKVRSGIIGITAGGRNYDCSPGDLSYFASMNSSTLSFLRRNVPRVSIN